MHMMHMILDQLNFSSNREHSHGATDINGILVLPPIISCAIGEGLWQFCNSFIDTECRAISVKNQRLTLDCCSVHFGAVQCNTVLRGNWKRCQQIALCCITLHNSVL